jgi:hypothetical protein
MRARQVKGAVAAAALAVLGVAAGRASKQAEPASSELAVRLAQEMAQGASRRDVKSLERFIPKTGRVVYVSNGNPITGLDYARVLGQYYSTLQELDLKWDKWEAFPAGESAAVFTGWASVKAVDRHGQTETAKAIFTMVFARDATGWKRVIAQKWQAEPPKVSSTCPPAAATGVAPSSPIAINFSEPVNVTAAAFRLECPTDKPIAFTVSPETSGEASAFVLHPGSRFPAGATCRVTIPASQATESHFGQPMTGDYTFSFTVASAR